MTLQNTTQDKCHHRVSAPRVAKGTKQKRAIRSRPTVSSTTRPAGSNKAGDEKRRQSCSSRPVVVVRRTLLFPPAKACFFRSRLTKPPLHLVARFIRTPPHPYVPRFPGQESFVVIPPARSFVFAPLYPSSFFFVLVLHTCAFEVAGSGTPNVSRTMKR